MNDAASATPGSAEREAWRHGDACVDAHFRLASKSSKDAVEGVPDTSEGPGFVAPVRAVPENGAANAALTEVVARWLDVPKLSVSVIAGGKSRLKSLQIVGDAALLDKMLQMKVDEFQR